MKKKYQTLALCLLIAVLVVPVATYVAWVGPGRSGILVHGRSPEGREFCVVQTYRDLVEPYQVSFYIRDAHGVWRWHYLEHEDNAWRKASVEFSAGKALVLRNGKPFREIVLPTDAVDPTSVRNGDADRNCPPEFTAQDVLQFHNEKYN